MSGCCRGLAPGSELGHRPGGRAAMSAEPHRPHPLLVVPGPGAIAGPAIAPADEQPTVVEPRQRDVVMLVVATRRVVGDVDARAPVRAAIVGVAQQDARV